MAIVGVTSLSAWRLGVERNVAVENLRDSYLSQAQALRWSGQAGRRFKSLDALAKAAKIRPGLELRNEAIACMPLVDLRSVRQWHGPKPDAFDAGLVHYARKEASRDLLSVRRVSDDAELFVVPGFGSGTNMPSFSPDGRWLVLGHDAHGVQVWDVDAGKPALKLAPLGSEKGIQVNAISPDSRRFAVHLGDKVLRICELPSGRELQRVDVAQDLPSRSFIRPAKNSVSTAGGDRGANLGHQLRPGRNHLAASSHDQFLRVAAGWPLSGRRVCRWPPSVCGMPTAKSCTR